MKRTFLSRLKKIAAVISLIVIVVPLLPPATFAQEANPSSDPGASSATQPSDIPAPSGLTFNVNPNGSTPSISPVSNSALISSPAVSPNPVAPEISPVVSPSSPSAPLSPGTPAVNEVIDSERAQSAEINSNTGGFTHTYAITVPPGRNSLQPDLKLTYATDNLDLHSIVGANWSISIPY